MLVGFHRRTLHVLVVALDPLNCSQRSEWRTDLCMPNRLFVSPPQRSTGDCGAMTPSLVQGH